MKVLSEYIIEKLKINKDSKIKEKDFILLEARNNYLFDTWSKQYAYVMTSQAQFNRLFIITPLTAEHIIKVNSKACYWMYEWPDTYINQRELQDALTHKELNIKDLNIYSEFKEKGKL